MEDIDNFVVVANNFTCVMSNGYLEINEVIYEEADDDPTYSLVREIWKLIYASV